MSVHTYMCMHAIITSEKEAVILNKNKEGYMEVLGGGKRKGEMM